MHTLNTTCLLTEWHSQNPPAKLDLQYLQNRNVANSCVVVVVDGTYCYVLHLSPPFSDLVEESPELAVPTNMSTAADLLKQGAGTYQSRMGAV